MSADESEDPLFPATCLEDLFATDSDNDWTTEESVFGSTNSLNMSENGDPEKEVPLCPLYLQSIALKLQISKLQLKVETYVVNTSILMAELDLVESKDFKNQVKELRSKMYEKCKTEKDIIKYEKVMDVLDQFLAKVFLKLTEFIKERTPEGTTTPPTRPVSVKLPKLELPTFDGKYEEWMSFSDLFEASIIKNTGLSDAQRLQYLKSSLKGEAERMVKSFSLTDTNFKLAWAQLEQRYANERDIVFALIRKFLGQPRVVKEEPEALRKLIDVTQECLMSLVMLKEPVKDWNSLVVCVLCDKLDTETRREWMKTWKAQIIPEFADLVAFLENHIRGLISGGAKYSPNSSTQSSTRVKTNHVSKNTKPNWSCQLCKGKHGLFKCEQFVALSVSDREQTVKSKGLCFNCFGAGHTLKECHAKYTCSKCKGKHNTLLHVDRTSSSNSAPAETQQPTPTPSSVMGGHVSCLRPVLLGTAMVNVKTSFNEYRTCRVLLDPGSEGSFVTEKCVQLLGWKPSKCSVDISGIAAVSVGKAKSIVGLTLSSLIKDFEFEVNCLVYSKVTERLPSFSTGGETWDYLRGLTLADPKYLDPREVDILLGADVSGFLTLPNRVIRDINSPVAMETELGWVITGPANQSGLVRKANSFSIRVHHSKAETDALMKSFWELEQVPERPQWTAEEKDCEKYFELAHYRELGGRYGAPLPFNDKIVGLGSSRHMALKRLEQVERRLSRGTSKHQYTQFMKEYEQLGHMELVPPEECGEKSLCTNYLPHHFVLREESTTTKLRVVFDGSAKTSTGLSFNECLMVGPKVQDDLFHHLLRFRLYPIALKADIVKMFRQFVVPKSDADFQRILWRESPELPVKEYRLKTVTYGTASAPHAAARCLKQLSLDYKDEFQEAAEILGRKFYVDDLLVSVPKTEDGERVQKDLDVLASKGEIELCKWDSNDPHVLEHVPIERRAKNSKFKVGDDKFISKALGVAWDSVSDNLLFEGFEFKKLDRVTKRTVYSYSSRVFDPLGIVAPINVKSKIFVQKLWNPIYMEDGTSRILDWDEELPEDYKVEWELFQNSMSGINEVKVPRVMLITGTQHYELHGFSDASENAYSAVIYIRCFAADGSASARLMCAKTKVAPVKSQSIPKLELCGALLLAHLITAVITATSLKCPLITWTDSELVLKWIAGSSRRWKTFVANRVAEIQELIPNESWRFIPGDLNPADCASRGMTADQLLNFDLWWNGPEFLHRPGLPIFVGKEIQTNEIQEIRSKCLLAHQVPKFELFGHYSDLNKLKRVFAYVLRFVHNTHWHKVKLQAKRKGELTVIEIRESMLRLVMLAQHEEFGEELVRLKSGNPVLMKSQLVSLSPFLDRCGVLRVGGRLQKSSMPDEAKHQIIVPGHHPLTRLLILHTHNQLHHAGFQLLWSNLQREYWILHARPCIRNLIRKCLLCKRLKAKVAQQLMGSLPSGRVNPSKPFLHTGIDYAGPFSLSVRKGRGMKQFKAYFCVFVCFATKAVHLEAVTDMTSESFIACLKRFVSRRGMPSDIYSDCGSNFVGADKELKEFVSSIELNQKVSSFLSEKGIQWHFNSPAAPHHGGLWEAGVKSVKYHLKRIIGTEILTLEEFMTVLTQVEAALNSRPLCALSEDPGDLDVLTPAHFLVGDNLSAIPEPDLTLVKVNRLSRWQRSQQVFQHFWRRWSKEYVTTLQERNRWTKEVHNVEVGDLVLIKEDDAPPLKWRKGRVTAVHPGADKLVRVVTVKTATGELQRPVVKICPLIPRDEL